MEIIKIITDHVSNELSPQFLLDYKTFDDYVVICVNNRPVNNPCIVVDGTIMPFVVLRYTSIYGRSRSCKINVLSAKLFHKIDNFISEYIRMYPCAQG